MPDRAILAYYEAVADRILPFLRGRRVAVRHQFDHQFIFRRHWPDRRWITIESKKTLLEIVRQHGYEFFPHLEGERTLWFALDIDVRAAPFQLGKVVVRTALDILDERGVNYLLTFSGGNGFHVRWAFSPRGVPAQKWQFLRRIVRNLRAEAERRLQTSLYQDQFYQHIPKGDPITELNAVDKNAQKSVLFDELILKRQATIRAPFSLHQQRRWVAVPVDPRRLEAFTPSTDATMRAALRYPRARLPVNPVALFLKDPLMVS